MKKLISSFASLLSVLALSACPGGGTNTSSPNTQDNLAPQTLAVSTPSSQISGASITVSNIGLTQPIIVTFSEPVVWNNQTIGTGTDMDTVQLNFQGSQSGSPIDPTDPSNAAPITVTLTNNQMIITPTIALNSDGVYSLSITADAVKGASDGAILPQSFTASYITVDVINRPSSVVLISWCDTPSSAVVGYAINWGTVSGQYTNQAMDTNIVSVPVPPPPLSCTANQSAFMMVFDNTTFTGSGPFYFSIQSCSTTGCGDYSAEVSTDI